jgi:hypothetical protein
MPSIGEYLMDEAVHELYTKVSWQLYFTGSLYDQVVVKQTGHRQVEAAQKLQEVESKIFEAYQLDYSTVMAACRRGW